MRARRLLVLAAAGVLLSGCATGAGPEGPSDPGAAGVDAPVLARGKASWYGSKFHGRRTASGERFDMNEMTAAHRTLPFGTRLRVRSLATGREVVVRINDRGPSIRERIIDLSQAAADALGVRRLGVFDVELLRE
jgi:rare lipoprotein A